MKVCVERMCLEFLLRMNAAARAGQQSQCRRHMKQRFRDAQSSHKRNKEASLGILIPDQSLDRNFQGKAVPS